MSEQVMRRKASDNTYLHKDFHGALSVGLDFLRDNYGEQAVREYLRQFTKSYFAPLREELIKDGLPALARYFKKTYETEEARVEIEQTDGELVVKVAACPAVTHMREHNYAVSPLFYETTKTVNDALCEDTPFAAELVEYDDRTGRSVQRFWRKSA